MRKSPKLVLLMLLAAGPLALLLAGCNDATDDPEVSPSLLAVEAVNPTTCCVDVDGEPLDTDGDGTVDTNVISGVLQQFTIGSRVRNSFTGTGTVWNDAVIEEVQITYSMEDGGATPAAWTWRPTSPLLVRAGGRTVASIDTVRVSDVGPGQVFDTAGRTGALYATFRGKDVTGEPIQQLTATVPLVTVNVCQQQ